MPLPEEVFLGAAAYDVREKKRMDLLGETFNDDCLIEIKRKQGAACKRDTLLHECLHGIVWVSGGAKLFDLSHDDEEKLVRLLTPWLLALIRDNPALIAYLTED